MDLEIRHCPGVVWFIIAILFGFVMGCILCDRKGTHDED